jgi:hypothetical protein
MQRMDIGMRIPRPALRLDNMYKFMFSPAMLDIMQEIYPEYEMAIE